MHSSNSHAVCLFEMWDLRISQHGSCSKSGPPAQSTRLTACKCSGPRYTRWEAKWTNIRIRITPVHPKISRVPQSEIPASRFWSSWCETVSNNRKKKRLTLHLPHHSVTDNTVYMTVAIMVIEINVFDALHLSPSACAK